jgi:hypothetical protein
MIAKSDNIPDMTPAEWEERRRQKAVAMSGDIGIKYDKGPITCVETGQVFRTVAEVTAATGIHAGSVMRSYKIGAQVCGLHFTRSDTPPPRPFYKARPVRIIDRLEVVADGRQYARVRDLAKELNIHPQSVYDALYQGRRIRGLRVEFAEPPIRNTKQSRPAAATAGGVR